ncbi:MAG: zinc ribbon domain-containing protein [Desulfobacterales bacterium]|nr:zinc ribbon domain-containing protein [Desulfobacterales bacterium]
MPIYEYECAECGHIEEALQKISEKPLTSCGHCSGKLHKLISQSTFHLKGTGWYVTDYANKANNTATPRNKTGEASTSSNDKTSASDAKKTKESSKKPD